MHSSVLFSLLLGAAPACLAQTNTWKLFRRGPMDTSLITLTWEKDTETGEIATSAWDSAGSTVYGYSCGSTLKVGDQEYTFTAGDTGAGKIKIGDKEYTIKLDGDGVTCSRRYNKGHAVTECDVPLPAGLDAASVLNGDEMLECFQNSGKTEHFKWLLPLAAQNQGAVEEEVSVAEVNETDLASPSRLFRRQRCAEITRTEEIDHPDRQPHKWGKHTQLTKAIDCNGAATCGTGEEKSYTMSLEASVSGGAPWFAGGFSVAQSETTTDTYYCEEEAEKHVCLWNWARYQEYNYKWAILSCGQKLGEKEARVNSPMSPADQNTGYFCVVDNCAHEGFSYMVDEGAGTW